MDLQSYFEQNKERLSKNNIYPYKMCKYLYLKFKMKPGMRLLDVGSGAGIQCKSFASLGLDVTGVDNIDLPKQKEFNYFKVDLENNVIPFKSNSFDIVFSKSVIEHIQDPDKFLKECARVLKKDGLLIILTPDWQTQYEVFYDDPTHIHPYTLNSAKTVIKMSGFKGVETEIFTQLPVVWSSKVLEILTSLTRLVPYVIFQHLRKFKILRFAKEKMILASARK